MKMPALFIGHGSPMNIIEENNYTRSLMSLGNNLPKPAAILVVSAHWQTRGTYITSAELPPTIYDFYGFPEELYQESYPCPGSLKIARRVQDLMQTEVSGDSTRGIDHAGWAVLKHMYPQADIPTLQLSLDVRRSPQEHYELGKNFVRLREEGVLIIGSGNIVHNLSQLDFSSMYGAKVYPWAAAFDKTIAELLVNHDHASLIAYENLPYANISLPTNEHYLPMLYTIAMQAEHEKLRFICTDIQNGSIAMRSFMISD
ncbi:MAG: ygiD [Massilibacillus sp.]|jgi:4,5-DOPA dioxygenase extradiol|nr:ygiD [Massilibacillus sp.]